MAISVQRRHRDVVSPIAQWDFVRCKYYDALNLPFASHATMLRTARYKLVVYHGHDVGELYDLQADPEECLNLWDAEGMQPVKHDLIKQLFDAVMLAMDEGVARVGRTVLMRTTFLVLRPAAVSAANVARTAYRENCVHPAPTAPRHPPGT